MTWKIGKSPKWLKIGKGNMFKGFGDWATNSNKKREKWDQTQWNSMTGKTQRLNNETAAKEAEKARREGLVKEYGAKQQADSLAYAGLQNNDTGSNNGGGGGGVSSTTPGIVGGTDAPGTIGANLTNSGTF